MTKAATSALRAQLTEVLVNHRMEARHAKMGIVGDLLSCGSKNVGSVLYNWAKLREAGL